MNEWMNIFQTPTKKLKNAIHLESKKDTMKYVDIVHKGAGGRNHFSIPTPYYCSLSVVLKYIASNIYNI